MLPTLTSDTRRPGVPRPGVRRSGVLRSGTAGRRTRRRAAGGICGPRRGVLVVAAVSVLLGAVAALLAPGAAAAEPAPLAVASASPALEGSGWGLPGQFVPARLVPEQPVPGPPLPDPIVPEPATPVPGQQPPTTAPTAPGPVPTPAPDAGSSCAAWDIPACISEALTGLLRAVVTDLVNAALEMVTDTLLQTPQPSQIPRLAELWQISWRVAVALYGVVILAGAVLVMAHQSVQTHYGLREIAPRLVVGFVAGWLTLPLADLAVQVANAVSDALLGPPDVGGGVLGLAVLVKSTIASPIVGGGFGSAWVVLLLGLVLAVGLLALLFGYVARIVATIVLIAAAPLVVMWHALPQTDGLARWWWRALAGVLGIQIVQALVLSVAGAILIGEGGEASVLSVLGLNPSSWVTLLVLVVLLWVLVKVPGWMWSVIRPSTGGGRRSLLGTAMRGVIVWKTGGLLRGALTAATGGRGSGPGRAGGPRGGAGAGAGDPYANPPVFAGGQLGLPFGGLRRRRIPRPAPTSGTGPAAAATAGAVRGSGRERRGVQLALPLGQDWPENRPVLDRGGQYRLPITAERVARPDTAGRGFAEPDPATPAAAAGAGQLRFPTSGVWPEQRPVAGRDGQYRLPIPVVRRPRTPTPPAGTPSRSTPPRSAPPGTSASQTARAGRQLSFDDLARDLDPFRGNRPLAGGQYPLPLPG